MVEMTLYHAGLQQCTVASFCFLSEPVALEGSQGQEETQAALWELHVVRNRGLPPSASMNLPAIYVIEPT